MKRISPQFSAALLLALMGGMELQQEPRRMVTAIAIPQQTPEQAQQKLAAAQAKRDRKKAKRAAPTAQESE